MRFYAELWPGTKFRILNCLIIELGTGNYVYLDHGKQVFALPAHTFDLAKGDIEQISEHKARKLAPKVEHFLQDPTQQLPLRLR